MTKDIEKLAQEIGELLAESSLEPKLRKLIIENIGSMPEDAVFKLRDALKNIKEEIDSNEFDLQLFLKEQEKRWQKLESDQKKVAGEMADELFEKLKDNQIINEENHGNDQGTADPAA